MGDNAWLYFNTNSKNQFWKIIFKIFNKGLFEYSYDKKTELLLNNKVGLWDVLTKAEREGSLDSNIRGEEFNDFKKLFSENPKIIIVIFNGEKAAKYFKLLGLVPKDKEYYILSSTSSTNTWKTFEQKYIEWKEILLNSLANKGS